jgi:hypothetical protein
MSDQRISVTFQVKDVGLMEYISSKGDKSLDDRATVKTKKTILVSPVFLLSGKVPAWPLIWRF